MGTASGLLPGLSSYRWVSSLAQRVDDVLDIWVSGGKNIPVKWKGTWGSILGRISREDSDLYPVLPWGRQTGGSGCLYAFISRKTGLGEAALSNPRGIGTLGFFIQQIFNECLCMLGARLHIGSTSVDKMGQRVHLSRSLLFRNWGDKQ